MRSPALALALALALPLAGCIQGIPDIRDQIRVPTASEAWTLDCALGGNESGWAHPCVARASHTDGPKQEIWIAVNPTNADNVVIASKDNKPESSNGCTWNGLGVTHDAGRSWVDVTIGGTFASRGPSSPYFGYSCNTDPMFAFAKDGALHYVVELYNAAGPDASGPLGPDPIPGSGRALLLAGWKLVLATSLDGGLTWPDNQTITLDQTDGIVGINDYSRVVVNPTNGDVVTAINTFSGGPFFLAGASYSVCNVIVAHQGGKSAERPVRLLPKSPDERSVGCSVVAAAPSGVLVLGSSNGGASMWAKSLDAGKTWSDWSPGFAFDPIPGVFNGTQYRSGTNFEATYAEDGRLHVVFAASDRDEADVYFATSSDDGKTWTPPVRVNDDENGTRQFMPNLAVAGDGSIHVFFFDTRHDAGNKLLDLTHAVSGDGGATWANRRVTNASTDGDLGVHQEGFPFIGDYNGASCVGDHCWAGFPDATTGTTVMAAAHVMRTA